MVQMSVNIHVHPDSTIEVVHQVSEEYQVPVIKLGNSYPAFANIFLDSPDEARRLRDAIDHYLVGRLVPAVD